MGVRYGKARGPDPGFDTGGGGGRAGFTSFQHSIPMFDITGAATPTAVVNGFRYRYAVISKDEADSFQTNIHPNYSGSLTGRLIFSDRDGVAGTYTFDIGLRAEVDKTNLGAVAMPDSVSFVSDGTANKFYQVIYTPTIQGTLAQNSYIRILIQRTDALAADNTSLVLFKLRYTLV